MENVVLKKGRKRLELKPLEVEALSFLENQRALTLNQYYEFCYHVLDYEITEYAFKNRIRKLEEFKVIRSKSFADGFEGERFKYLSVGAAGVDLLIKMKRLPTNYNKRKIYTFLEKENLYHYFATQQVIIDFYRRMKEVTKRDARKIIKSLSAAQNPYKFWVPNVNHKSMVPGLKRAQMAMRQQAITWNHNHSNKSTGQYVSSVIPDWILHHEYKSLQATIHIELDTGTETLEELELKALRYLNLAERNPQAKMGVVFVLPDETFMAGKKFGNRDKRIQNIKSCLIHNQKLLEKLKERQLIMWVVPLKKAAIAIEQFFRLASG